MKHKKAYATDTSQIIAKMQNSANPVTASVYRVILGNRIDRLELHRLHQQELANDK